MYYTSNYLIWYHYLFFFFFFIHITLYLSLHISFTWIRNFQQWWSTSPPISTKKTTCHLIPLNTLKTICMTYALGQGQTCGRVKLVNCIPNLSLLIVLSPMTIHIYKKKYKNLYRFILTQKEHILWQNWMTR